MKKCVLTAVLFLVMLSVPALQAETMLYYTFEEGIAGNSMEGSTVTDRANNPIYGAAGTWNLTASAGCLSGCDYPMYTAMETGWVPYGSQLCMYANGGYLQSNVSAANLAALTGSTSDSFTIEAWINAVRSGDNLQCVAGVYDVGGTANSWFLGVLAANPYQFKFYSELACSDGGVYWVQNNTDLWYDQWYHVALTWDAATSKVRIYVDGGPQADAVLPAGITLKTSDQTPFTIGRFAGPVDDGAGQFTGHIDDVRLSDKAIDVPQMLITPPPSSCLEVQQRGFGLALDLNADCSVDLKDFAIISRSWLTCNVPGQTGCLQNWY
ncbi:MAG: hypothetical protein A2Y07_06475 [Planctomycetes bacterium GWF2_50_10]|nr:MAG: hypothetical protein A2Y07_06475 [Planctomycetes bacterium GWF2_50_10]